MELIDAAENGRPRSFMMPRAVSSAEISLNDLWPPLGRQATKLTNQGDKLRVKFSVRLATLDLLACACALVHTIQLLRAQQEKDNGHDGHLLTRRPREPAKGDQQASVFSKRDAASGSCSLTEGECGLKAASRFAAIIWWFMSATFDYSELAHLWLTPLMPVIIRDIEEAQIF
jgi:hypothetical protein